MGVFEMDAFAKGTLAVANMLADLTDQGCTTVIGGGDSGSLQNICFQLVSGGRTLASHHSHHCTPPMERAPRRRCHSRHLYIHPTVRIIPFGSRRRREGGGDAAHVAHLDGRRRIARAPRGQDPPGGRRA